MQYSFDLLNFAITATSMTAVYNMIPDFVEKEIRFVQNSSHGYLPDEEYQEWFVYNNNKETLK